MLIRLSVPRRVKIPLRSGRIIEFTGEEEQCITSEEHVEGKFVIIGHCETVARHVPGKTPGGKCDPCKGKRDARMRCDLVKEGRGKVCIRCGTKVGPSVNYSSCTIKGWGDWVMTLTQRLGLTHCAACSKRRMMLNELDRKFHRWRWERKNAKSKKPT